MKIETNAQGEVIFLSITEKENERIIQEYIQGMRRGFDGADAFQIPLKGFPIMVTIEKREDPFQNPTTQAIINNLGIKG